MTVLLFSVPSLASEAVIYRYDALGRLTLADARATSAQGRATSYTYDSSSNRAHVSTSVVRYSIIMPASQSLNAGETIGTDSPNYRLTLERSGDLVLYDVNETIIWRAGVSTGTHLIMQNDGNLVLYDVSNAPVWSTSTAGHSGAYVALQADGNIVVYTADNHAIWGRFGV